MTSPATSICRASPAPRVLADAARDGVALLSWAQDSFAYADSYDEVNYAGEHTIKGKTELQKVYRLDAVRSGATRFHAAISHGLSGFVGRERKLELLERALDEARSQLRAVDLVAEPGMGKSRLLHEFRHRIGKDRALSFQENARLTVSRPVRPVHRVGARSRSQRR